MEKTIYHALEDPAWRQPVLDLEEQRERQLPDGRKLPYLFVHGRFEGIGVKFAFSFPEKGAFQGRFYQYLSPFPGPEEELASQVKAGEEDVIAFCLLHGAYFVESNMGAGAQFGPMTDPTLVWKASAAVAEFSRRKAMELYGCGRPYGYVFGGSGGGYKTMACIENTDAWDGAAPYVIGSPVSLPNTITLRAQGQRVLRRAFRKIVDNVDAGGSGNPCDGLNDEEAAMLREIMAMGFDPRIWYCEANGHINDGSLPVLMPLVKQSDPGYFADFWTVPGYEGADPANSACRDRLQFRGKVRSVHVPGAAVDAGEIDDRNGVDTAWQKMLASGAGAWIELESVPQGEDLYLQGVTISPVTGPAAGKQMLLDRIEGNCLLIGMCYGMDDLGEVLSRIRPGDELTLDNSDYIAVQHYYRHQVPEDESFHAWDQFRGKGIPQRKSVLGYVLNGTGTVQDGNIQAKTMVVQALMDESTCPWCGDWYREKVSRAKGSEEDFRLYTMDRCMHGDVASMENNMVTHYLGAHRQVLLDLAAWVEQGVEPLPSSVYAYENGQIVPPATAGERKGIQPVVELTANGSACARVKVGETVHFRAMAQVPAGAGTVTALDFGFADNRDLPGGMDADYPVRGTVERREENGITTAFSVAEYRYDKPGTYFAAVRVKAQRSGNPTDPFTQVRNLARAKIIVEKWQT